MNSHGENIHRKERWQKTTQGKARDVPLRRHTYVLNIYGGKSNKKRRNPGNLWEPTTTPTSFGPSDPDQGEGCAIANDKTKGSGSATATARNINGEDSAPAKQQDIDEEHTTNDIDCITKLEMIDVEGHDPERGEI